MINFITFCVPSSAAVSVTSCKRAGNSSVLLKVDTTVCKLVVNANFTSQLNNRHLITKDKLNIHFKVFHCSLQVDQCWYSSLGRLLL